MIFQSFYSCNINYIYIAYMFAGVYTSFIRMNKSAYRINRIILLIKRRLQLIKYFK